MNYINISTKVLAVMDWQDWLWLGIGIATFITAIVALLILLPRRRKYAQRHRRIAVTNTGNMRSRYKLRAENPDGSLDFDFLINGIYLPEVVPTQTVTATRAVDFPDSPPSTSTPQSGKKPKLGGAKKSVGFMMKISFLVADVLSTFGMLLPRSIGGPLLGVSLRMRQGQGQVQRVQMLSNRVGKNTGTGGGASSGHPQVPSSADFARAKSSPKTAATRVVQEQREMNIPGWVQTSYIEPGETLTLDMVITPPRPYKAQQKSYRVISKSLEYVDTSSITQEDIFQFSGLTMMQRYGPFIIIVAGALAILGLTYLLLNVV